jgi:uncharacterized protein (UPF0335 family)
VAGEAASRAPARDQEAGHRVAKDQLKALVERIERLQEEKKAIGADIADVYREAKGNGFDITVICGLALAWRHAVGAARVGSMTAAAHEAELDHADTALAP